MFRLFRLLRLEMVPVLSSCTISARTSNFLGSHQVRTRRGWTWADSTVPDAPPDCMMALRGRTGYANPVGPAPARSQECPDVPPPFPHPDRPRLDLGLRRIRGRGAGPPRRLRAGRPADPGQALPEPATGPTSRRAGSGSTARPTALSGRRQRAGDRPGQGGREPARPADRRARGQDRVMPPKGPRLTAEQVGVLRDLDRPGGRVARRRRATTTAADWWSLRPLARPDGPRSSGRSATGARNPIDALRPGQAAREGADPVARGRPPDADPPALLRPDRPAADARGGRRVRRRPGPDAYEKLVDRLLASPALRRALGAALARRRPLRRHARLRQGQAAAQRLALPRLRHPGASTPTSPTAGSSQEQVAGDVLYPGHGRRHRRRSGSSPPGRGTSSATPRCPRRRSTARSPATSTATTWSPTRSTRSSA